VVDTLETKSDITASEVRAASFYIQESIPVAERLENTLHPWTSYVVIPIFALANAGIVFTSETVEAALSSTVAAGVFFGLLVGKTVGVGGFSLAAVKLGICDLPARVRGMHMVGISMIAGIGFTVSLFIAELAFDDVFLKEEAKMAILAASVVAALVGALVLVLAGNQEPGDALELDDVDGDPVELLTD
jgi:NhaA family Na+:H+ antiporter